MKRVFNLIFITFVFASFSYADRTHQLKVLNWADYISPEVQEEFPKWYFEQTGEEVEIIYSTFDINESALTKIEVGKEDYDVFCPSEYIIEKMLNQGLLLPLKKELIPDSIYYFDNVSPFAVEKFNQMSNDVYVSDYAVGYMWGTTGWLYNPKYVNEEDMYSWSSLMNSNYRNKIFVKDAYRDVYFVLVQYCYYDDIIAGNVTRQELTTNITKERIDSVYRFLVNCRDNIEGYEVDFGKEAMVKGEGWLNLSWSGDAYWAITEAELSGVLLNYIVPNEGSNVWFDGWVIPKYAKNTKAATYFIDYMCREDNVIKNMEEIGYVSCVATPKIIETFIDDEFQPVNLEYLLGKGYTQCRVNSILYPDKSVIDRCELMHDAGDMNKPLMEMWNNSKGSNLTTGWIVAICLFGLSILCYILYKLVSKIKSKNKLKTKTHKK